MSAWWNLIKKEYRMTRNAYLISLFILLAGGLWLVYMSHRYQVGIIIVPTAMLLTFLVFYPALYMLRSLAWESKITPHLWLHCPQPAWMLLSAKLAVSLVQMLVIIAMAAGLLLWGIVIGTIPEGIPLTNLSSMRSFIMEIGFYSAVFIFAASIYIGAWATFISVLGATSKNILGRFRWLAGLGGILLATWGMGNLQQSLIFDKITRWGQLNIRLQNLPEILQGVGMHTNLGYVYTGQILFYLVLTVVLYFLSTWLLEHKVEV